MRSLRYLIFLVLFTTAVVLGAIADVAYGAMSKHYKFTLCYNASFVFSVTLLSFLIHREIGEIKASMRECKEARKEALRERQDTHFRVEGAICTSCGRGRTYLLGGKKHHYQCDACDSYVLTPDIKLPSTAWRL